MTDTFAAIAFPWVLQVEGRFTKDPHDKGNWTGGEVGEGELRGTKFGVSAAAFPAVDIEGLTHEGAAAIYREHYWETPRLRCNLLPPGIALAVFDCGVNQGQRTAAVLLQGALRTGVDGIVGPETIGAAKGMTTEAFLPEFLSRRAERYAGTKGAEHYLRGWMSRLFRLELACLRLGSL